MKLFLVRWLINAVALYIAVQLIPGLTFEDDVGKLLLVSLVFGLVNSLLRPILTILTCPLMLLTLGLFTFVINALMLLATSWLSQKFALGFAASGFWPAFWGGLIISLISWALSLVLVSESET